MPEVVVHWILRDLAELSTALCVSLLAVGMLLFVLGGYGHRFWLVLGTTLTAGIIGLQYGPQFGMQPLVAGLFLGLAVGALSLAIIRIAIFLAVGALSAYLVSKVAPGWNEQMACFLVGGLLGVLLFRVWIMVLTSLLGTVLITYSVLLLIQRYGGVDVAGLAQRNWPLFNWGICGVALLGLVFQTLLMRRGSGSGEDKSEEKPRGRKRDRRSSEFEPEIEDDRSEGRSWWMPPFFGKKAS